jgi:hypothetical protein
MDELARRVRAEPLIVAVVLSAAMGAADARAADPAGAVLASYSFDDDVPTGPDTFRIFQYSKGSVRLTSAYHVSGYRAIELRDVAKDKSMPEIQGYFPLQSAGVLHAHFSFMTATPREELNIALAGPHWFRLEKDGIGFWLKSQDGSLVHYSDSIPKRLFPLEAFVWYTVDVAYDVTAGTYDLVIRQEGREAPLVVLFRQKNAPNQPGSGVDKFSFVGEPFGDSSNVVYYVDDIIIGTSESVVQGLFVAPGRRKLFVHAFAEYRARESARPRCLPGAGPEDFGLTTQDTADIAQAGAMELLSALATGEASSATPIPVALGGEARRGVEAAALWNEGCVALDRGDANAALSHFESASWKAAEGRIYKLSAALALVALGRGAEAGERLALEGSAWGGDVRYAVALAMAGTARGDLERAEEWLRDPAEAAVARGGSALLRRLRQESLTPDLLAALKAAFPRDWQEHLTDAQVSEEYFYVLLWRSQARLARDYALRMADRYLSLALDPVEWTERGGDAAFYDNDLPAAKASYDAALRKADRKQMIYWSILLKLSDVAFASGDLAAEQSLREQFYGSLREH